MKNYIDFFKVKYIINPIIFFEESVSYDSRNEYRTGVENFKAK